MSTSPLITLKATNGTLNVFEDKVEISRKSLTGILSQGIKGDRVLFYKDLSSVEYKKPTLLANGYIKFILAGTSDVGAATTILGTTTQDSLKDPNTLILRAFNKETPIESEKAYKLVMEKISQSKTQANVPNAHSDADELLKFKNLLDSGVITQDEFDAKKRQILGL